MSRINEFLFVTLGILVIIILYRFMIKRMSRHRVRQEEYCVLYSLEVNPAFGEIEFYFVTPEARNITFSIWKQEEKVRELAHKEFSKGGHILRFDSTEIENGEYFFGIETNNQKTIKRFEIKN